jgi:hypothetical protein
MVLSAVALALAREAEKDNVADWVRALLDEMSGLVAGHSIRALNGTRTASTSHLGLRRMSDGLQPLLYGNSPTALLFCARRSSGLCH